MKTNNFLKVAIGVSSVAQKALNIADKSYGIIEDKILKGNYVTRVEFEKLQTLVIKLKKELTELKDASKNKRFLCHFICILDVEVKI